MNTTMIARLRAPRVFELRVTVTAPLYGRFEGWPDKAKDAIYEAMERCMERSGVKRVDITSAYTKPASGGLYELVVEITEQLDPDDVRIQKGTVH